MVELKYKVIKTASQYKLYCKQLEALLDSEETDKNTQDEIDLLTALIELWDTKHNTFFADKDPVQILEQLMEQNNLRPVDLYTKLNIGKGLMSDILNYKKAISKENVRKFATYFKVAQEAFNRDYQLQTDNPELEFAAKAKKAKSYNTALRLTRGKRLLTKKLQEKLNLQKEKKQA